MELDEAGMTASRLYAGIGLRAACTVDDILGLIDTARGRVGGGVTALATWHEKAGHPALREAAERLGVPLLELDEAALRDAAPLCPTPSSGLSRIGLSVSLAEAAALAAAGPGAQLVLPRISTPLATLAFARSP
jgi:cobalt-precorrin 5A hydrolase